MSTIIEFLKEKNLLAIFMFDPKFTKITTEQFTSITCNESELIELHNNLKYDLGKSVMIGIGGTALFRNGIKLVSRPSKVKTLSFGFFFGFSTWFYYADRKLDQFLRQEFAKAIIEE